MQSPRPSKLVPVQYGWQESYLDAMLEADEKLPEAIEFAIQTIIEREKALRLENAMESKELNAISNALANLRALKKVRTRNFFD